MNTTQKNRIMQVSEMIANNILESALDFQHNTTQSKFLWEAVEILAPELEELDKALEAAAVGEALDIHQLRNLEVNTTYVIGVLMGLHLAGRTDLASKFADLYARDAKEATAAIETVSKETH